MSGPKRLGHRGPLHRRETPVNGPAAWLPTSRPDVCAPLGQSSTSARLSAAQTIFSGVEAPTATPSWATTRRSGRCERLYGWTGRCATTAMSSAAPVPPAYRRSRGVRSSAPKATLTPALRAAILQLFGDREARRVASRAPGAPRPRWASGSARPPGRCHACSFVTARHAPSLASSSTNSSPNGRWTFMRNHLPRSTGRRLAIIPANFTSEGHGSTRQDALRNRHAQGRAQ